MKKLVFSSLVLLLVPLAGCQSLSEQELSRPDAKKLLTTHLASVVDSSWAHSFPIKVQSITKPSNNDRDVEFTIVRGDSIQLAVVRFQQSDEGWKIVEYREGMSALVASGWVQKIRNRYADLLRPMRKFLRVRAEWIRTKSKEIGDPEEASLRQLNRVVYGPKAQELRDALSSEELPSYLNWRVFNPDFNAGNVLILHHASDSSVVCRTYLGTDNDPPPPRWVDGIVNPDATRPICEGRGAVYDAQTIREAVGEKIRREGGVIRLPGEPDLPTRLRYEGQGE